MKRNRRSIVSKTIKTAAIVGAPLFLAESELHAAIVYVSTPQTFGGGDFWHINNGAIAFEGEFQHLNPGDHFLQIQYSSFGFTASRGIAKSAHVGVTLAYLGGINISSHAVFPASSAGTYYGFTFGFSDNNYFGWANISTDDSTPLSPTLTINNYAFNNVPNGSIVVGDTGAVVPEPADFSAGLGALALGAAAIMRRRRREKAA